MKSFFFVVFLLFSVASASTQSFYDALVSYFSSGDLTQAKLFIGRTVNADDMRQVAKNYPGDGLDLSKSRPRLGVSVRAKESKVVLYSLTSKLVYGKSIYEIWDLKSLQLSSGYTVYADRLMTQSRDFPNGNMELEDAIGLLIIKEGERVPEEQRLVPNWIITADKDGKLILTEPKDKSKYLFMQGGPI